MSGHADKAEWTQRTQGHRNPGNRVDRGRRGHRDPEDTGDRVDTEDSENTGDKVDTEA